MLKGLGSDGISIVAFCAKDMLELSVTTANAVSAFKFDFMFENIEYFINYFSMRYLTIYRGVNFLLNKDDFLEPMLPCLTLITLPT